MQTDIERVKNLKWFHAIDFGEFCSQGRFKKGLPQNSTLYGAFEFLQSLNFIGGNVMDIGTFDGIVALGVSELGAGHVSAVDTFERETFQLAKELVNPTSGKIDYFPSLQLSTMLGKFKPASFDVVCCAGIFYHMLNPMESFIVNRKLISDGGYLILETPFEKNRDEAVLIFNGTEHVVNEPNTYFVPTLSALKGMANLSGFEVLAVRELKSPERVTLLLKACGRDYLIEHKDTPPFVVQMLKRDLCDDSFRFKDLESAPKQAKSSATLIKDLDFYRLIDAHKERVTFPLHPSMDKPAYGSTIYEQADGNTKVL